MKMYGKANQAIVRRQVLRQYRLGFHAWAIAKTYSLTLEEVREILKRAGVQGGGRMKDNAPRG